MNQDTQNIAVASSLQALLGRSFSRNVSIEEAVEAIPHAIVTGERSSGKSSLIKQLSAAFLQQKFVQLRDHDERSMANFLKSLEKDLAKFYSTKGWVKVCICLDDLDKVNDPGALKMLAGFLRSYAERSSIYLGTTLSWLDRHAEFTSMLAWPFLYMESSGGAKFSEEELRLRLGERAVWLADHSKGKEFTMERMLLNPVWENNDAKVDQEAVRAARTGDIVLMKSSFTHRTSKESILRIKAVGVVMENPGTGSRLWVNWAELNQLDFPGLGNYRRPFQRLLVRDVQSVLGALYEAHPDFSEGLTALSEDETFLERKKAVENKPDDKTVDPPGEPPHRSDYAYADAIASDQGERDSLNFKRDVQALAALIALKDMRPPLAIALFGKWGSGKSFFMQSIEFNVRQLSQHQGFLEEKATAPPPGTNEKHELFHRGIAHIKFNAWSYLDANLWAGLAHSLFEKLDLYIRDNTQGELERLKVQVKITKRLELLHSDLESYEGKRTQLEELKSKLERERNDVLLKWFQPKYDARVKAFLHMCGLEDKQIEKLLPSQLKSHAEKAANFFAYLRHKSYRVPARIVGVIALLWVFKGLVVPLLDQQTELPQVVKSVWSYLTLSVVPFAVAVFNFTKKHSKFFRDLGTLLGEEEGLKNPAPNAQNPTELEEQLQRVNELIAQVKEGIEEEKENQSNITELAIQNFVANIPTKEDYTKHLGIITTIRRDFETLSDLFAEKDKDPKRAANEKERKRIEDLNSDRRDIREAFDGEGFRKLDRIVLYIDDLDRCSDEKVLEVLQAVHLLMAFPLFIVIVGVDERCVNNALTYAQLKRYRGIDRELIDDFIHEIEPREYLEKIFQIPFQLPVASEAGVQQLIDDIIPQPVEPAPDTDPQASAAEIKREAEAEIEGQWIVQEDTTEYKTLSGPLEVPEVEFPAEEAEEEEAEPETPEEEEPTLVAVRPEAVRITLPEKEMLQLLSPLVGNNPRTIKRYVNIFRIVKTHEQAAVQSPLDMAKVVFLLAMFIGERRKEGIDLFKGEHALTIEKYSQKNDPELYQLLDRMRQDNVLIGELIASHAHEFRHLLPFVERFSYKIVLNAPPDKSKPMRK